jgi:hypothetical protein
MVFSKTAHKIPSKITKNIIQKIYLYRYYGCVLLFQDFPLILPLLGVTPLSPFEFSGS